MSDGEVGFSKLTGPMQLFVGSLACLGVIVPAVLGFVNLDKRQDILEHTQSEHIIKDEVKWEKVDDSIDMLKDKQHVLEMQNTRIEGQLTEILHRMDRSEDQYREFFQRIFDRLDTFEVVQDER